ncbi:hypothetical protein SCHPADRAFT_898861 [Schizopora paradoxa]|uniref:Uncharacterized protein n=1 Tax=Schizopora paradoxa TaxID=27342 RepID=A0A0H2S5N9_9AGAM|nr:hypothetical protein SCHPADRAFT_898861 [Schizopora paradoxa]
MTRSFDSTILRPIRIGSCDTPLNFWNKRRIIVLSIRCWLLLPLTLAIDTLARHHVHELNATVRSRCNRAHGSPNSDRADLPLMFEKNNGTCPSAFKLTGCLNIDKFISLCVLPIGV